MVVGLANMDGIVREEGEGSRGRRWVVVASLALLGGGWEGSGNDDV